MSYILDALKKSEKMRQQGDVPDLQTVHMSVLDEEKSNRGLYFIIMFLLVSIAFLIGVYQPWRAAEQPTKKMASEAEPVAAAKQKIITENKIQLEDKPKPIKTEAVDAKPLAEPVIESVPLKSVPPKSEQAISQQAIREVPRLSELSPIVQQAIPNMIFAGHVYSSSAAQRSIIINGYPMSEGDVVVDGLSVKQITRDGVIFDYQGQLFREEILQDWSFD